MGLFDRKNKIQRDEDVQVIAQPQEEQRTDSLGYPVGLSFDIQRLIQSDNNCLSTFYGCIELISNDLASIPILVKDKKENKVIENHYLKDIFSSLNIPKFLLIKQLISDAYRHGDGFAYIKRNGKGQPVQVIYRPHGNTSISYNPLKNELYYLDSKMSSKKIEPINMIHVRKNTLDGISGISISKYGAKIFDLAKATDSTAKDFFDSGCNVSGVLTSTKPLNPKAKEEVLADWRSAFNSGKANNVGVLGYDLKYTPVSNNANDSQLLQSREYNVLEICRYFCINPIKLGIKAGFAYGNLESAQWDYINQTLLPWVCLLQEEFNNKLVLPSEKENIYIDFDEDKIMFLDKNSTANYYTNLVKNGLISINEAREAMGYGPREGADDLIIPYTNINDNKVEGGDKEEENKENDKEKENIDG